MHLTPIEYVVKVYGTVRAVSKIVKKDETAVSKWKKRRGEAYRGSIPTHAQIKILRHARKKGLDVNAEDLILGREI